MALFREHRWLNWLTLFALSFQMFVSLGHKHSGHVDMGVASVHASTDLGSQSGSGEPVGDRDQSDCAICWTAAIAASLAIAFVAVFIAPVVPRGAPFVLVHDHVRSSDSVRSFNPRGPPGFLY